MRVRIFKLFENGLLELLAERLGGGHDTVGHLPGALERVAEHLPALDAQGVGGGRRGGEGGAGPERVFAVLVRAVLCGAAPTTVQAKKKMLAITCLLRAKTLER